MSDLSCATVVMSWPCLCVTCIARVLRFGRSCEIVQGYRSALQLLRKSWKVVEGCGMNGESRDSVDVQKMALPNLQPGC